MISGTEYIVIDFTLYTIVCHVLQRGFDLQVGAGGSHRTLLYGHAVLFLHSNSGMVSHLDTMHE